MTRFVRTRMSPPRMAARHPARMRALSLIGLTLTGALLAGCTSGSDELQQWMEEQRQQTRPTVKPLTPPKTFQPQPY